MTDQSIKLSSQSIPSPFGGALQRGLASLQRLVTTRCEQRQLRAAFMKTAYLYDKMLDDIGVTRAEVDWAVALPLEINASRALFARAKARRMAERP